MTTALLLMDVQIGIVERYAEDSQSLLAAVSTATTAARTAGHQVIYVRVAFRPGAPEVSRHNRAFAALAGSATMGLDDPATQVHPAVAPHAGDIEVMKKRVSVRGRVGVTRRDGTAMTTRRHPSSTKRGRRRYAPGHLVNPKRS